MTNAALERRRRYAGPALFSYGFRIFFLSAAIWAAGGILLWLPVYLGLLPFSTNFSALDWHIHEMLFGYAAAAIAGFLLTAIPNWTGRLPVNGAPLAALASLCPVDLRSSSARSAARASMTSARRYRICPRL